MSEFDRQRSRRNFVGRMAAALGAMFAPHSMLGGIADTTLGNRLNIAGLGATEMATVESLPGSKSRTFAGIIGKTYPPAEFPKQNYLIDQSRFDSEGNWAFCRFDSEEIPAVRMGFQRGGFNVTPSKKAPDKLRLQLHLEIVSKDGTVFWLPSGQYPADNVITNPESMDIQLQIEKKEIFSILGWPEMDWHFRSPDGEAEVNLHVSLNHVTLLPDCILPECVFSMWEAVGDARGIVRYRNRTVSVNGRVFYDHPRIIQRTSSVIPRNMYLYTTMYFEDGSSMFGYHAEDDNGKPIRYYCFGVYTDPSGKSRFLTDGQLVRLEKAQDNIPKHWQLGWKNKELVVEADIEVRERRLLKIWGSPTISGTPPQFDYPLVLDGHAKVTGSGDEKKVKGRGLAEYYSINP
jgi:hypothetical protein